MECGMVASAEVGAASQPDPSDMGVIAHKYGPYAAAGLVGLFAVWFLFFRK
jgi:hypothetical protein